MRISDWSSDVCSSDLLGARLDCVAPLLPMLGVAPSLLVGVDVGVRKGSKQRGARPLQLTRRGGRLLRSLRDRSFTPPARIETDLTHLPGPGGPSAPTVPRHTGPRTPPTPPGPGCP